MSNFRHKDRIRAHLLEVHNVKRDLDLAQMIKVHDAHHELHNNHRHKVLLLNALAVVRSQVMIREAI